MARPIKEGLDYFPMDVDILHNIKIRRVIKQYGEKGLWLTYFCFVKYTRIHIILK